MLMYIAEFLSGQNGADLLGSDILTALLRTGQELIVVSKDQATVDARTSGKVSRSKWISSPRYFSFPSTVDRRLPRKLGRWVKWSFADKVNSRRIRREDPKLVLVNSFGNHELWSRHKRPGIRSVLIVQESPRHFGGRFQGKALEWALRGMEAYNDLIFVSARCLEEWSKFPELRGKNLFAIPNCCTRESDVLDLLKQERDAVRERLGFRKDRFVAVCVGSLQHRKGQDLLVSGFTALYGAIPDLELYLVGAPVHGQGPDSQSWTGELKESARRHKLSDRIHFCGGRPNALEYIYAADVLVLPTRAEAMPITILEAMALGTPVAASAVDGIPELIEHEVSGMLFDLKEPSALVTCLHKLRNDSEFRTRTAAQAKERYWAEFSRRLLLERYTNVICDILKDTENVN